MSECAQSNLLAVPHAASRASLAGNLHEAASATLLPLLFAHLSCCPTNQAISDSQTDSRVPKEGVGARTSASSTGRLRHCTFSKPGIRVLPHLLFDPPLLAAQLHAK